MTKHKLINKYKEYIIIDTNLLIKISFYYFIKARFRY